MSRPSHLAAVAAAAALSLVVAVRPAFAEEPGHAPPPPAPAAPTAPPPPAPVAPTAPPPPGAAAPTPPPPPAAGPVEPAHEGHEAPKAPGEGHEEHGEHAGHGEHAEHGEHEHGEHEHEHGEHEHGEHGEHGHGEHGHGHHNEYFVGLNGVALAAFSSEATEAKFGGGGFIEFGVIPNWLEIEIGVHALHAPGAIELPIDVLLKKPFHVNPWFHPYVGFGPTVVPEFLKDEKTGVKSTAFDGGIAFVAGSYFWLHPHVGLSLEIDDNLLLGHGIKNELGGSAGVVFGW